MAGTTRRDVMRALVDTRGRTYAQEAGIRLRNTPQPLYQLLVLADLLSARISADIAVAAARELSAAGLRDPRKMADATSQERVDALGRGGYRRYDERTARQLGEGAELARERYDGDLRELRQEADGDLDAMRTALQRFPGIGPAGADIFLREAQAVWPEAAPYFDEKAMRGARALDLPTRPGALLELAGGAEPAVVAAALVRAALDKKAPQAVREAAAQA